MRPLIVKLLAIAALAAAPAKQTFTGAITDSMCAKADHSQMQMGPTDAECAIACIREHDATYVLYDGKNVYTLSDQQTPEKFAAQKVTVMGTLDAKTKTIHVDSITSSAAASQSRGTDKRSKLEKLRPAGNQRQR